MNGVYLTTRRDGLALLVMYVNDRPVEVMGMQTRARPKRRTTRRLGDTITGVVEENRRRREERLLRLARDL
jgi:hypothetical protein